MGCQFLEVQRSFSRCPELAIQKLRVIYMRHRNNEWDIIRIPKQNFPKILLRFMHLAGAVAALNVGNKHPRFLMWKKAETIARC